MTRAPVLVLGLALVFALATAAVGWWAVPIIALAAGVALAARRRAAVTIALGAVVGWVLLLAWDALSGPLLVFAGRLAGAMGIPSPVPLLLTLIFPAVLAWSAAAVGQGARAMVVGRGS